jgi:hypothetical protein
MPLRFAGKQEGHIIHLKGGFDLCDHRIGDDAHIHRAKAHAINQRAFIANGAIGKKLHLHTVTHALFQGLLEKPRAGGVGVKRAIAAGPAKAQHGLALRAQNGGRHAKGEYASAKRTAGEVGHALILP